MKQAAALGLSPTALQSGIPTVPESKPSTIKTEKENTSQYSAHTDSQIPIFKPVKPNSIHTHRYATDLILLMLCLLVKQNSARPNQ